MTVEYATVSWTCHPRFITCPGGHLYRFKDVGMQRDHRLLDGHEFFRCELCRPASSFFAVFATMPDLHATCYLISDSCWREWINAPDQRRLSTREMLYLIRDPAGRNYNPTFVP